MALALVSLEGARRLSFDTDVLSLLPRDSRVIQAFRTFLARFGSLDQLYVVFTAPEGHAISEYADEIDAWVDGAARRAGDRARRRGRRRSHARLRLARRSPAAAAPRSDRSTRRCGRLSPEGLPAAVAARRELLTVPSAEVAELVRQDPAGLFDLLREALGGAQAGSAIGVSADGYVTRTAAAGW